MSSGSLDPASLAALQTFLHWSCRPSFAHCKGSYHFSFAMSIGRNRLGMGAICRIKTRGRIRNDRKSDCSSTSGSHKNSSEQRGPDVRIVQGEVLSRALRSAKEGKRGILSAL